MSLLSAMRQKRELKQSATDSGECRSIPLANANPANFANPSKGTIPPLARLATLALANPPERQTGTPDPAAATNTKNQHFAWLIHFTDRNPLRVTFSPEVDHAGALACHPDAVAAEPIPSAGLLDVLEHGIDTDAHDAAEPDDRITCRQCSILTYGGVCSIATPGGKVSANKGYRPAPDLLQRCAAFTGKEIQ